MKFSVQPNMQVTESSTSADVCILLSKSLCLEVKRVCVRASPLPPPVESGSMCRIHMSTALTCCVLILSVNFDADSFKIPVSRHSAPSIVSRSKIANLFMQKDEYDSMKIDESKLSASEVERLAFIRKLTLEADEIIKAAGFSLNDEELDETVVQRSIRDTKWSGQSDVEESIRSRNNLNDVSSRKGLATGDSAALVVAAAMSRSYFGDNVNFIGSLSLAIPLIFSWLLISPFLGAFSREATSSKGNVPKGLFLGWLVSVPIAIAATEFFKDVRSPVVDLAVLQLLVFVVLGVWRVLYISLIGETSEEEYKSAGFFEVFKMIKTLVKRW